MEQIRSFIAIELPENIRHQLTNIQQRFKSVDPSSSKWIDPTNIHLTLKFLGNIDTLKIAPIKDAISYTIKSKRNFILHLGSPGIFPDKKRVRIIWVGIQGDLIQLYDLQKELDTNLSYLGFEIEKRAFSPHLTIARIYDNISPERRLVLADSINNIMVENTSFLVNSIILFRSELTRSGAIYTKLSSFVL